MIFNVEKIKYKEIEGGNTTSPKGFHAAGIHCGIRRKKKDLGLLFSEVPALTAAVYTMNTFQAAPLQVTKQTLASSPYQRALIVNSGNANAFTGDQGMEDALKMKNAVVKHFNLSPLEVIVASTGVIGEKMPMDKIELGISELPYHLNKDGGIDFSEAIMTTDTKVKNLAVEVIIDGKKVIIGGVAKGSGMIHPNMATMFAFITTDAKINFAALQKLLRNVTDSTFNMITVDGDTSTNDMVTVMANGMAANTELDEKHPDWFAFYQGFNYVSEELAKMIAADGEGATKLIAVNVEGADDKQMAKAIAKKIVASNLVKTAVFGADGNWGRIVMAIGNSGYYINEKVLEITIGNIQVVKSGQPTVHDEQDITEILQQKEVTISVNLNLGFESATAWGCDLSYEYVRINASYRT